VLIDEFGLDASKVTCTSGRRFPGLPAVPTLAESGLAGLEWHFGSRWDAETGDRSLGNARIGRAKCVYVACSI